MHAIDLNLFLCMVLNLLRVTFPLITAPVLYTLGVNMLSKYPMVCHMLHILSLPVLALIPVTIKLTILEMEVPRAMSTVGMMRVLINYTMLLGKVPGVFITFSAMPCSLMTL